MRLSHWVLTPDDTNPTMPLIIDAYLWAFCSLGASVLSQASDCASILFEAAGGGNPDSVSLLLEYGADANVAKHSGHLPIHRAAYRGHFL